MTINLPRVHCNVKEGDIIFGLPLDMFLAHRRIIAWEEIRKTHCIVNTALSALVELFRQRSAAVIEPLAPLHMLQPASKLTSDRRIGMCRISRTGRAYHCSRSFIAEPKNIVSCQCNEGAAPKQLFTVSDGNLG